jgi:hypothetical protein
LTCALGIRAPDVSVIVPRTEVKLVCASSGTTETTRNTNSASLIDRIETASKKDNIQSSRWSVVPYYGTCPVQTLTAWLSKHDFDVETRAEEA